MDAWKKDIVNAADLVERLSRLAQELGQSNRQATDALQHTVNAAPGLLQQAAQHTLSQLTADTTQAVQRGLNQPLHGFNRGVIDSVNHIQGVTQRLMQSQAEMESVVRKLSWLVAGVAALMLLVAVAGAGTLWHYRNVIAENQIQAELMRAYNHADVSLCDGSLCARVNHQDKRYGDYLPVKPRLNNP